MYAVIKSGGKQYRVTEGEVVRLELLNSQPGDKVTLPVMMLGGDNPQVGTPFVDSASVTAEVIEHGKGKKLYINKFKAKSNYRRRNGHRQQYTEVRITEIAGEGIKVKKAEAEVKPKEEVVDAKPEEADVTAAEVNEAKEVAAPAEPEVVEATKE